MDSVDQIKDVKDNVCITLSISTHKDPWCQWPWQQAEAGGIKGRANHATAAMPDKSALL